MNTEIGCETVDVLQHEEMVEDINNKDGKEVKLKTISNNTHTHGWRAHAEGNKDDSLIIRLENYEHVKKLVVLPESNLKSFSLILIDDNKKIHTIKVRFFD